MAVPTYEKFIDPILRYLAAHPDGSPARDVYDAAAAALQLSDTDRQEFVPSGAQATYKKSHRLGPRPAEAFRPFY